MSSYCKMQTTPKKSYGAECIEQLVSVRNGSIHVIMQLGALHLLIEMLKGPAYTKRAAMKALIAIEKCKYAQNEMEKLGLIPLRFETSNGGKKVKRSTTNLLGAIRGDNKKSVGIEDGIKTSDKKNQASRKGLQNAGVRSLAKNLTSEIHHEHIKTNDLKSRHGRDDRIDCEPTDMRDMNNCGIMDSKHTKECDFIHSFTRAHAQNNENNFTADLTSNDGQNGYDINPASSIARNISILHGRETEEALSVETLPYQTRDQENCADIADQDVVQNLVTSLRGNYKSRIYASRALSNLACTSPENRVAIADYGAIPLLVRLLRGKMKQQANAVSALSSLIIDSENYCVEIERCGAVPLLIAMLQSFRKQRHEAATILEGIACHDCSKVAKSKNIQSFVIAIAQFEPKLSLPVLTRLAGVTDDNRAEITRTVVIPHCTGLLRGSGAQIAYALQSFENLMKSDEANTHLLAQNNGIPPLISLLNTDHKRLAAKLLGMLATDNVAIQIEIVENSAIPFLEAMSKSKKRENASDIYS